ncbi:hypothetical protein E2C01_027867 [Portunus trituberculatus]|uniref:Uncharacterized protein n=1 Tax=Portunus trituberculatus TaxID=210409 RepID=A0A5B7EMQ1_PORTR|nr:hypothetical protein [Portunus trituberculatus]
MVGAKREAGAAVAGVCLGRRVQLGRPIHERGVILQTCFPDTLSMEGGQAVPPSQTEAPLLPDPPLSSYREPQEQTAARPAHPNTKYSCK